MRIDLSPDPGLLGLARLAARFTRYRVQYCAIGGFATAMYLPGRRPGDLDLIIAPTLQAGERAEAALASLIADPKAGASASNVLTTAKLLAEGDQLVIPTAYGTLHILGAHLPAGCDRATIVRRRRWFVLGRYPLAACSLDDLIRIKTLASHRKDATDVAQLISAYPRLKPAANPRSPEAD